MRKVTEIFLDEAGRADPKNATKAIIYKNAEWGEYVVKFYLNGDLLVGADYHSAGATAADKADAIDTAMAELRKSDKWMHPQERWQKYRMKNPKPITKPRHAKTQRASNPETQQSVKVKFRDGSVEYYRADSKPGAYKLADALNNCGRGYSADLL